ncbi:hypothetical protein LCGC14_1818780 [marine sediment metagenome]|uniref:Uncharacterized protein n=1 Tax=marine sediment metagenome TaxID=412755 RepID=A0A0F9JJ32_9ZZZZ
MRNLKDLKEFAKEELERIKDGSDDPLRDFDALKVLCEWCLEVEDKPLKNYSVNIDYPSEIMNVEATSKEEAEDKALEMLGDQTINCGKVCTAEAEEIKMFGHLK